MKMPSASAAVSARFEEIVKVHPEVAPRKMFGQPAAFVGGNMCFGVFGEELFLRLGEPDRVQAQKLPGAHLFEPMAGRAMREYVVFPPIVRDNRAEFDRWVARSVKYVKGLPPKAPKNAQGRPKGKGRRP